VLKSCCEARWLPAATGGPAASGGPLVGRAGASPAARNIDTPERRRHIPGGYSNGIAGKGRSANTGPTNMKLIPHKKSAAVQAWLKQETAEQHKRYRRIAKYINETLAPTRRKWIKAFLERIQTRGYSVHYDQLRKISRAELPKEPRRKHKFVF